MADQKTLNNQIEAVRESGKTNLADYQKVHDIATANGLTELADASKNPQTYSTVLAAFDIPALGDYQKWHARQETLMSIAQEILHQNDD